MHPHEKTRITHADIVARGWEAVARGDWEALTADYVEDMIFVMPGQTDVLTGKPAFRVALANPGAALPQGFEIQAIRQIGEMGEVVSVVAWSCTRHQLAVLFRFEGDKIAGERWFVDTEPWHSAF
jgi:ketosteroid isomerase-like protein